MSNRTGGSPLIHRCDAHICVIHSSSNRHTLYMYDTQLYNLHDTFLKQEVCLWFREDTADTVFYAIIVGVRPVTNDAKLT